MEYEFDYYTIANTGELSVPLLMNDDREDENGINFLYLDEYAHIENPVYLTFNTPVPPKPNLDVDYLQLPSSVFSEKVKKALTGMDINKFQLVPTIINGRKGEEYTGFYIANVYNKIQCFDENNSVYELSDFSEAWEDIEEIFLSKEHLSKIPLKDRLIFKPKETRMYEFYHKSVVDIIMSVDPKGVEFIPVEEYVK